MYQLALGYNPLEVPFGQELGSSALRTSVTRRKRIDGTAQLATRHGWLSRQSADRSAARAWPTELAGHKVLAVRDLEGARCARATKARTIWALCGGGTAWTLHRTAEADKCVSVGRGLVTFGQAHRSEAGSSSQAAPVRCW